MMAQHLHPLLVAVLWMQLNRSCHLAQTVILWSYQKVVKFSKCSVPDWKTAQCSAPLLGQLVVRRRDLGLVHHSVYLHLVTHLNPLMTVQGPVAVIHAVPWPHRVRLVKLHLSRFQSRLFPLAHLLMLRRRTQTAAWKHPKHFAFPMCGYHLLSHWFSNFQPWWTAKQHQAMYFHQPYVWHQVHLPIVPVAQPLVLALVGAVWPLLALAVPQREQHFQYLHLATPWRSLRLHPLSIGYRVRGPDSFRVRFLHTSEVAEPSRAGLQSHLLVSCGLVHLSWRQSALSPPRLCSQVPDRASCLPRVQLQDS